MPDSSKPAHQARFSSSSLCIKLNKIGHVKCWLFKIVLAAQCQAAHARTAARSAMLHFVHFARKLDYLTLSLNGDIADRYRKLFRNSCLHSPHKL